MSAVMKLARCIKSVSGVLVYLLLMHFESAFSQTTQEMLAPDTLKRLSMEELLNVEVISVSRQSEKLTEAASAIQVITHDDIRRSGATSIPEALRLATNLHVAQKNSHDWAISARGFNTDLANKLLVLIDGRTVYTPLFSGVFWDRQDFLLEDIERIEVISGPGGTLWGANAVNGVINIITRKAHETDGFYGEVVGGSQLRGATGLRYGGKLGEKTFLRMYGKYFDRDESVYPDGEEGADGWRMGQGGFRLDSESSGKNMFTLQGDYYDGQANLSVGGKTDQRGGNILGRWSHFFSEHSEMRLQLYYDKTFFIQDVPESRTEDNTIVLSPAGTLQDNLDTYDLDFQHTFRSARHHLVWGLGYRYTHDEVGNAPGLAFVPEALDRNLFNLFLQDEILLVDDISFTLGTKVEHNDYTGFEYEPCMRLQWRVATNQFLWMAVSRAVRMPSRIDRYVRIPTPGFAPIVENLLVGGANFRSETMISYELGQRMKVGERLTSSLSGFYNVYDRVRSTSQSPPDQYGLTFPLFYENNLEGEAYGFEMMVTYQFTDWWRVNGGYTLFREDIRVKSGKADFNQTLNETADPRNRFSVRTFMNLSRNFECYGGFRFVDSFHYNDGGVAGTVARYSEIDLKVAWFPTPNLELSVTGQNLLNPHHSEYVISNPNPRQDVERSFYIKVAMQL